MKRLKVHYLFAAAALAAVATSASAQNLLKAEIPFTFHAGQALETQLQDGFRLDLVQSPAGIHQVFAGDVGGGRSADQGDHFVQVVQGDEVALQDVGLLLGFLQLELGAAHHHFVAELDELGDSG